MDASKIIDAIDKVLYAITIVGLVIMIVLIGFKIVGHSPTILDLLIGLQLLILGVLLTCCGHFLVFKGRTEEFMKNYMRQFGLLAADFKASQTELRKMQIHIAEIKRKLSKR